MTCIFFMAAPLQQIQLFQMAYFGHISKMYIKAALINIFILPVDQMVMYNAKVVTRSDKPTKKYYPTLQFPSAVWRFIVSFSSLFWFYGLQLYCFGSFSPLSSELFPS